VVKSGDKWDEVERREPGAPLVIGAIEQMFLGQYKHSIDEKGRLTIPSRYRDELTSDYLVLTTGFEDSLIALTPELFTIVSNQIRSKPITNPTSRQFRRFFFSNAQELEIDKTGRILLPVFLRETANLKDNAILVGNGEYFELWSPENWDEELDNLNNSDANEQRFSALDLTTLP
jgi:MraZ protein